MKNNARPGPLILALVCALASAVFAGNSYAATATGTASATVIEPISVGFVGAFDPATLAGSLSASGPLLRFGSNPPAGTVNLVIDSGGSAPSQPNNAKIVVTKNADGTVNISVTGRVGLTFAVTQPDGGVVTIEYN